MPKYLLDLPDHQMDGIRAQSKALGISVADVLRLAVNNFLSSPVTSGSMQLGQNVLISGGVISVRIGG